MKGSRKGIFMTEYKGGLAMEIICQVKKKLWWCSVALAISLAGNIIQAIALINK